MDSHSLRLQNMTTPWYEDKAKKRSSMLFTAVIVNSQEDTDGLTALQWHLLLCNENNENKNKKISFIKMLQKTISTESSLSAPFGLVRNF